MFRLQNSHPQAYFVSIELQDAMHTLGPHRVFLRYFYYNMTLNIPIYFFILYYDQQMHN